MNSLMYVRKIVSCAIGLGFVGSYLWYSLQDSLAHSIGMLGLTVMLLLLVWWNERNGTPLYNGGYNE